MRIYVSPSYSYEPSSNESHNFTTSTTTSRYHQQQLTHHHHNLPPSLHPQFKAKAVCKLTCQHCDSVVCTRGMKAILLADTRVELYSTDIPPAGVQLANDDYMTKNCRCRIRDAACLVCGNVVGYHVTQPCDSCMDACNNGHFWMFHTDEVSSSERRDHTGMTLLWASIPVAESDQDILDRYEVMCR